MAQHSAPTPPLRRRRRASAVAASGLLLGVAAVGLTTTNVVATWQDPIFGEGASFQAANIGFELSVNGGAQWISAPTESQAATMALNTTSLTPGVSAYSRVDLRTTAGSPQVSVTVKGTPTGASAPLGDVLRYTVIKETTTCTADAFGPTATYLAGSAAQGVGLQQVSTSFVLPAGTIVPRTPVSLCFRTTLPDTLAVWTTSSLRQQSTPVSWIFQGTAP